jgi:hypothetical protein
MRELGLTAEDLERVRAAPELQDTDPEGRPRFTGVVRGVRIRLVLAVDRPDVVVTVHRRRR